MTEANKHEGPKLQDPPAELGGDHAAILAHYIAERPDPWKTARKRAEKPTTEDVVEVTLIETNQNQSEAGTRQSKPEHDDRTEEQILADRHDYWRRNPWG